LKPTDRWGRHPLFQAKVGTFSGTLVMVKRVRDFELNQRIDYCEITDVDGMSTGCTPPWKHGIIWKIDGDRLFISKA
jgi:hypothetical protein